VNRTWTGLSFAASVCLAWGVIGLEVSDRPFAATTTMTDPHVRAATRLTSPDPPNFRGVAAQNAAAIVVITATPVARVGGHVDATSQSGPTASLISADDPFYRFYRYLPVRHVSLRASAVGSGFIVSSNGVILTNAHWVRDASHVSVQLADRRRFEGEVLTVDPLIDVAAIKINTHNLSTVEFGKSGDVAVGDPVLAVGGPEGSHVNATAGSVSAIGKSGSLVPFIRTDIAAQPGGSGGPLFDRCGRVVGMNAQIYTSSRGHEEEAFAIPIGVALGVASQVMRTGEIEGASVGDCGKR